MTREQIQEVIDWDQFYAIPDFNGYFVNQQGIVLGKRHKTPMTQQLNEKGYSFVQIINNSGRAKKKFVHRLVATVFLPNPENKPEVNHKNGVKTDNNVGNLEWVTSKENVNHAMTNGLFVGTKKNAKDRSKVVGKYDLSMNLICAYPSANEATRQTGVNQSIISLCCNERKQDGSPKIGGGFIWKYIEATPEEVEKYTK